MSRILVLGGAGEMGSVAVADLIERGDHEVTVGDVRPEAAGALLRRLGAPERVVRGTNQKVERRVASIERALAARGKSPAESTLAEMDALWNAAKAAEK